MVFTKLCDSLLFCRIILCADDLIHPPFITACCRKHTAHQMIMAVCMCKCVQRIVLIYTEFLRGDKDRATCTK